MVNLGCFLKRVLPVLIIRAGIGALALGLAAMVAGVL